jgi:hypothetical protein
VPDAVSDNLDRVVLEIANGRTIPFLGAGVNLTDRTSAAVFDHNSSNWLPSGTELADFLAGQFRYPEESVSDLARVCQYVVLREDQARLYEELHKLFDRDYPISTLHRLMASIPQLLRNKGYLADLPIIITTNYDNLMERALVEAGVSYDLVVYCTHGRNRGQFIHYTPEGQQITIEKPNEYTNFSLRDRPVVMKIHGEVKRNTGDSEDDYYVVTEDDYIDYLTRTEISNLIPTTLLSKMRRSRFLFLGYGLRDWNLRVILHRIWGEQQLERKSWAIQHPVAELDAKIWASRNVDVLDIGLAEYVQALLQRLAALPKVPA